MLGLAWREPLLCSPYSWEISVFLNFSSFHILQDKWCCAEIDCLTEQIGSLVKVVGE
jgi:hypothetical protein